MKGKNLLTRELEKRDSMLGDFDEIPRVSIEDKDDNFDIDYRCTDYGEAMDFF